MADQAANVPYRLVEIEGKGRGLVATKDLEVGDLVLKEKAFLKLPANATEAFYEAAFSSLGPELQSKLMNLFPVDDANLNNLDKNQILLRKFNANCFEVEDEAAPVQQAAVFEMLSMVNHSCESNVMWFADEVDKTRIEVRVCRRIKKGDEIVLSYIISLARVGSCFPLRQQRMDKLRLWGFECRCQLCSLSGEDLRKDEDLRKELQSKDEKWRSFCDSGIFDQAIEILKERVQLIEANRAKFSNQMSYAYDQCEEAAATLCGEAEEIKCNKYIDDLREMEKLYRKKSLEAAATISKTFEKQQIQSKVAFKRAMQKSLEMGNMLKKLGGFQL